MLFACKHLGQPYLKLSCSEAKTEFLAEGQIAQKENPVAIPLNYSNLAAFEALEIFAQLGTQ